MDSAHSSTISALEHIQLFVYYVWTETIIKVASMAILVFDYFLTVELEIKYIWSSKWSIPNAMFLFTRYLPFVDFLVLLYRTFSTGLSIQTCNDAYRVNGVLVLVGIVVAEIILSLRTWAVWGRSKVVGIGLIIFTFAAVIPAIPVIIIFSGTATFVDPPYHPFHGCFLQAGSRILLLEWILLMIYDAGLLILMVVGHFNPVGESPLHLLRLTDTCFQIAVVPTHNESFIKAFFTSSMPGEFIKPILKDGVLYYFYLFGLMERVIHAVLTCRVVLHIKDNARTDAEFLETGLYSLETMQFER
ncbi:hypothetical protein BDQ17DRAFT_1358258 [Cyathus striatus]|nr:hypothetical protein BDQ17DRAFT_1358258 [Cyathus striatus]